jgi:chromosomal replication initiator protein
MANTTESVRADGALVREILAKLQEKIGPQKLNAWFRNGTRLSLELEHVRIAVPNPFVANWIETHFQAEVAKAVKEVAGWAKPILVVVDPALTGQLRRNQLDTQAQLVSRAAQGQARPQGAPRRQLRHELDDFVVGTSNRLAWSAAAMVAQGKAGFNPLFIHGPCGVGKTHLLQGVCNQAGRSQSSLAWRYVTAEEFTNEFIQALRHKRIEPFRVRYRNLDLLAIDDVHFLSAKKATQDEFLHTFNAITGAGKQVILASDAAPRMVGELNEQLVSRFAAGMVVRIETPDHPTRMEILRRKAATLRVNVTQEAMEFVARHVRGSVRELEGAMVKVVALAALERGEVTGPLAAAALADHLARTDSALALGDIEAAVAAYFGISVADLHSSRRTRTVSTARMLTMFLARRRTQMSYPEIGRAMGKNHSSVVLAVQRMEQLLSAGGKLEWMTPMGAKSMDAQQLLDLLNEQIA